MDIGYLADHEAFIPELAQLHFSEWGHYRPGDTVEERIERLRGCCGKGDIPLVVVGLLGSVLCGSAMLVAHDMESRPELTPWLAGVYVKPPFRRSGYAASLISRIEAEARAMGIPRLFLYTKDSESLYIRLGWSGTERCQYKGIDVTVMSKQLAA